MQKNYMTDYDFNVSVGSLSLFALIDIYIFIEYSLIIKEIMKCLISKSN